MPGVVNLHQEAAKVQVKLIVAVCQGNGIGRDNQLPWRIKTELAHFAKMTKSTIDFSKKNAVVMGRKTWESLPARVRPLKNRINIVLSRQHQSSISDHEDVFVCHNYEEALSRVDDMKDKIESCWIIGGTSVYQEAMNHQRLDKLYITRILKDYDCDTFFPAVDTDRWSLTSDKMVPGDVQTEDGIQFKYEVYEQSQR